LVADPLRTERLGHFLSFLTHIQQNVDVVLVNVQRYDSKYNVDNNNYNNNDRKDNNTNNNSNNTINNNNNNNNNNKNNNLINDNNMNTNNNSITPRNVHKTNMINSLVLLEQRTKSVFKRIRKMKTR